ncbi:unnamed protein product [Mesocestoides corti]|uniref:Uncharacterized protein n=1 Tax=Mesocestoides corti TaxID=53468 RepID=A0A0R3UCS3_MESCO|nr:unnamed protein product [Mesocestoides corti]
MVTSQQFPQNEYKQPMVLTSQRSAKLHKPSKTGILRTTMELRTIAQIQDRNTAVPRDHLYMSMTHLHGEQEEHSCGNGQTTVNVPQAPSPEVAAAVEVHFS